MKFVKSRLVAARFQGFLRRFWLFPGNNPYGTLKPFFVFVAPQLTGSLAEGRDLALILARFCRPLCHGHEPPEVSDSAPLLRGREPIPSG